MAKHNKNNHGLSSTEMLVTVGVTSTVAFFLGKAIQKNEHHKEIRKMKKTVKDLKSELTNNK